MCACLQDPEEIDRHMAGKRFRKLKQQYDEAEAAREARKLLPKDSADAIADRIGGEAFEFIDAPVTSVRCSQVGVWP
jgi:hypothetical protein